MLNGRRVSLLLIIALCTSAGAAAAGEGPSLSVALSMTKDPAGPLTLAAWQHGLGSKLDAAALAREVKALGATALVLRAKWLDGLCLYDTKTTTHKTRRDFAGELAAACQKAGLPLVLAGAVNVDGNREFRALAVRDARNWFILVSETRPFERHSSHSAFRKVAIEQIRERLTNYGPLAGIRLGGVDEPLTARSKPVAEAYQKLVGAPIAEATPATLARFNAASCAGLLTEVRGLVRKHQPGAAITLCGSPTRIVAGGPWAAQVGPLADAVAAHVDSFDAIDGLARLAALSPKPVEAAITPSKSPFTPNDDAPPPCRTTPKGAVAEAAVALCQNANVLVKLTPGHAGAIGDDLACAKAVGAWLKAARPLLRDATPYADVAVVLGAPAPDGTGLPTANRLWTPDEPEKGGTLDGAAAIASGLSRAGLFPTYVSTSAGGAWPPLAGFRAVVVPELAVLDAKHQATLRAYVQQGGLLVAFGHATLLDAHGKRRKQYALADVFGATCGGRATFPAKASDLKVSSDSIWGSRQFPPEQAIEGHPSFWASGETKMPHWIQFDFPETIDVARVELVNRTGGYNVCDVDVQVPEGKGWRTVREVRNAKGGVLVAALDKPVSTAAVRLTVLRETVGGKDRIIADIATVRVVDAAGVNRAKKGPPTYPLAVKDAALAKALGGGGIAVPPRAVLLKPTGAQVLATVDCPGKPPAIVRNSLGKGSAILVAAPESVFTPTSPLWTALAATLGGQPTVACTDPARYRVVLARRPAGHALHVIDRHAAARGAEPADVTVSLNAGRLGGPTQIVLPKGSPPATRADGLITLSLRPDPVASVVLK